MEGYIIIGVIIVLAIFIISRMAKKYRYNRYRFISNDEVLFYVNKILTVMGNSQYGEEFSQTMIIPIDSSGQMYRPSSDQLEFSFHCGSDSEFWLPQVIRDTDDVFQLEFTRDVFNNVSSGRRNRLVVRTAGRFDCPYKEMMNVVYKLLKENYPQLKLQFDGSRIMFNNPYK